ncbi:MAG: ADP-ribosylglycohydrolase family protein [Rhodocyclaceae bacterium]|nr:ADP-ribosylglycohydrolase family protein [Rhodocyclaceae bacterium]
MKQFADAGPDRYRGCLLGLALGDALGAPHEGGPLERALWRLIGRTRDGRMRWTDDTQMSLDLAESILACRGLNQDDLARRFAASYHWSRGYGPGAARVLRRIRGGMAWHAASRSVYRDGSFGNGAAMRAPLLGLLHAGEPRELQRAAVLSGEITHAHPQALVGAALVARATALALTAPDSASFIDRLRSGCTDAAYMARLDQASAWLAQDMPVSPRDIRRTLGNGVAAIESCVTAVYLAARSFHEPYENLIDLACALGGDVDSIAAMAGAIWGARRGGTAIPAHLLDRLEQRDRLEAMARQLHAYRHAH